MHENYIILLNILKQYLFSRYFGPDVALEQLSWLLKGCGISLPMGFVEYNDLKYMSHIGFHDFNKAYNLIDPVEQDGITAQKYSECIDSINDNFKYPHYYNGLIALVLLFSSDESYDLIDPSTIENMCQETKTLAITGYDEFIGFGIESLNMLICTLRQMSNIFNSQDHNYQSAIPEHIFKVYTQPENCFEKKNGIRTQIRAVDFSKESQMKANKAEEHLLILKSFHATMPLKDTLNYDEFISNMMTQFQKAYWSATSAFVLTTMVGKKNVINSLFDYHQTDIIKSIGKILHFNYF